MKLNRFYTCLASLVSLASWAGSVHAAPFGPGEKLTYAIKFTGGVKAGEMQMDLHENPRAGGSKAYLAEAVF